MSRNNNTSSVNHYFSLFDGAGEMASLMRDYDWDTHPMGNPEQWPESLKTSIRLILNSDFPMFIWWSKNLYMFHNDAYLPALGKKHPQALGASARDMWAEIWEQVGHIVEEILGKGKPFYAKELKMLLERKGFSEETYWTFSYSPAPNDKGGIGGIFCACNEVTKTVLGQRRLNTLNDIADATAQVQTVKEATHLTSSVLLKNPDDIPFSLIYVLNGEGTKARLSGQSGHLPQEWAPKEINLSREETMEVWSLAKVLRNSQVKIIQLPFDYAPLGANSTIKNAVVFPVLKPGEEKLIGFFIAAISPKLDYDSDYRNFHGLLAGQIATSLASIQAREEGKRQQEELINLFKQAPVAIAILRGGGYVVELANPPMCEFWGRTYEQVINQPVFEALPEARGQGLEDLLQDVLTNGTTHAFSEFQITLKRNGKEEIIYANFIYYPFRDSKGIIKGVTAIAVEVSEQVKSRKEIEAKNKQLMDINADLDNFVYSASHDLKGPILNIEGLMKILLPKLPAESLESKNVKTVVDMIFGSIDRLRLTIADLSEVSRVQKEANEDVRELIVAEIVQDVLSDMQLTIKESAAVIEVNIDSCPVHFSAKNFKSVVYNLVSNAIKYKSPDRPPHIRISCKVKEGELLFSVSDNGLGMNLKYENKIFSMFKRLHSHVEGSGVGLYIVKRIVENAGGRIEVKSKVGKGSIFTIFLKL